jgi:UDP-N-acetylmuramate dehydrogenase
MPKNRIKALSVDLANWSQIKIGSKCSDFYLPESIDQLREIYEIAEEQNKKTLLIAGGSNILFGNTAAYIVISDANLPCYWRQESDQIVVSGNYNISRLVMEMSRSDLGGLEFLCGVPAHIAGLVKMNAGAFGSQISEFVNYITVLDKTKIRKINKAEIDFSYRSTNISECITEICLTPKIIPQSEIIAKIKSNINKRRQGMPINLPNLGSVFINPPDTSAGYLLEKAGFKNKRLGDAAFSTRHANVMVNLGKATFSDAWQLITSAREKVKKQFDIELELEIEVVNS